MSAIKGLTSEKTEFGPGKTALYYNNVGLFSDPFLEERLPNLEKYYKSPSTKFLNKYWNIDDFQSQQFNDAFQGILNIWHEMDEDVSGFCENEAQLEEHWIKPIFKILGWTYEVQDKIEKRGKKQWPDYSLFESSEYLKKAKNSTSAKKFVHALSVADAKSWNISLDGKGYTNSNPSFQIVTYMELTKKNWGILTNGRYWRIYSLRSDSKHTTYYEIDLEKILATMDYDRFKYFYNFFRVEAFIPLQEINDRSFLDFVFDDGQSYKLRIEDNLKQRAFSVVETICRGFAYDKKASQKDELKEIYDHSLYYLFKLMFILNCESKGLLEVGKQDDYYLNGSLRKKCMDLKEQWESGVNWSSSFSTYNYINDLFKLLEDGDERIGVHSFGKDVFSSGRKSFYKENKIPDFMLNKALVNLATAYDSDDNLQFIDYKILSPDHIGSLFEGLLEYKLIPASEKIFIFDGRIKKESEIKGKAKKFAQVVEKGELYLGNDDNERKDLGAYYTPDYIVNYICKLTLEEITRKKSTSEILSLNICDPAMGSGHFLLGVVKYLDLRIQEIQESNPDNKDNVESDLITWNVLHNCIYGVDVNPLAVELAKFSLWIYSAKKGMELEPLADQLKFGNSLVDMNKALEDNFIWEEEFKSIFSTGGFDSIVGNPPYLGERGNKEKFRYIRENGKLSKETYKRKMDLFYWFMIKGISILKPNGTLSYITTNYWPTADGAETLKNYLVENGSMTHYVDFLNSKIFKDATGQCNSLFKFKKGEKWDKSDVQIYRASSKFEEESLKWDDDLPIDDLKYFNSEVRNLQLVCPSDQQWIISKRSGDNSSQNNDSESIIPIERNDYSQFIGKNSVSMGVQTGCDKVTNSLLKLALNKKNIKPSEKDKFKAKEGIFVISKKEAKNKEIEKDLLLNWYKNSDLGYYYSNSRPSEVIIYTDSQVNIKKYPKAKKHLAQYRSLLASREQANNEESNWYWIRGAKRDKIYGKTTIVCPYRSKVPKFTLSQDEVYGAGDIYYIFDFFGYSPEAMLGYLNSSFVEQWFAKYGKKKGNLYELYQTPLSEIPVPKFSKDSEKVVQKHVVNIFKHVESLRKIINDESILKKALDYIAEYKFQAVEHISKELETRDVLKMVESILKDMKSIDEVVYSVMLTEKSKKKAA